MKPILLARSILFIFRRPSSRYIPMIKDFEDTGSTQTFAILRRFGTGLKIFDVYDTHKSQEPIGSTNPEDSLFYFLRSRAVKGAYRMYPLAIEQGDNLVEAEPEEPTPVAALRAGVSSNVLLIKSFTAPAAELGWHHISHKIDAIDSYKMFTLADGFTYQWTTRGRWLEKVHNLGERESEIRERIGKVELNGARGFTLHVDTNKIPLEIALCTALCSYLDQWNTNLEMGGIFYPRQPATLTWNR